MATTYARPSDWLTMPTVATSSQTFVGLFAVLNNDSNYVALKAVTNTGNYQVDWGNGTVTTHASNTTAEYQYTYSAINESTLSSKGYKQVLITVTPVSGNITQLNMTYAFHSALGNGKMVSWLEWLINLPFSTNLTLIGDGQSRPDLLEKVTISSIGSMSNFSSLFTGCISLRDVNITAITTGVTNTTLMFQSCPSLVSVNLFNTSNVTNISSMFYSCYSLGQIPNFNFSKVTTAANAFRECYSLRSVPALDMRLTTDFSYMFQGCNNLTEIGLMDTRSGIYFTNFAYQCLKLRTVANLNMSGATTATNTFSSCHSLDNFPAMNVGTASCNLTSFFLNTSVLKSVGDMNVSKVINFSNFFAGNTSLRRLPALNLNAGTTLTNMMSNVATRVPFTNVRASLSVANKNLGRTMIVEVFNGLASGVSAKTITVSANPGYASLTAADRLIATAKGWTIA